MKSVNIGVDVGGMSIKAGVVDSKGNILFRNTRKTNQKEGQLAFLKLIKEQLIELINIAKENDLKVTGVGFGIPGVVNNKLGTIDYACNLGFEYVPLKEYLKDLGVEIYLSNDANVACLAEQKFGAAKGKSDVILLTLGTGVGGGVVIDNKLFEGIEGKGAELGHHVIVVDGRNCSCGRKGCFEAYASASALIYLTKKIMNEHKESLMWEYANNSLDNVNGLTSFECAKKGDKAANIVVDTYIKYLSEGILNFCNIFRPNVVVIGGGISNQKEYLLNKVIKYCEDRHYGYRNSPKVDIVIATLGNDAGIIGAAHLLPYKDE